jgi:large subunit ribosomal protein L9
MKVILLETMSNLGNVGDIVNVRDGYARNYLLPKKKVTIATDRNVKIVNHQKLILDHKMKKAAVSAAERQKMIQGTKLTLTVKAGKNGKLFGSVTAHHIERALAEREIVVSRRHIHLPDPIKQLGTFEVPLKLDGGIDAKATVEIVAQTE